MNTSLIFRKAAISDLDSIMNLLYDDMISFSKDAFHNIPKNTLDEDFKRIEKDTNQELTVVVSDDRIVGTFQLTFIPYLSVVGGLRAQIEGIRVHKDYRNKGIGKAMLLYIKRRGEEAGCSMIQLTTNKNRLDAQRFYLKNGFEETHLGMKLKLKP